jgi:hypothetical protein
MKLPNVSPCSGAFAPLRLTPAILGGQYRGRPSGSKHHPARRRSGLHFVANTRQYRTDGTAILARAINVPVLQNDGLWNSAQAVSDL